MSGVLGSNKGPTFFERIRAAVAAQAEADRPQPPSVPAAQLERDRAMEEARRRSLFGRTSTNPTGGLGDTSTPNLASKSLLGL
jgi:hypothetical protein